MVIVWKLDRFARDRHDSANYKNILKNNGVRVLSAKENISDGPEGIILESPLEGMAEYYSAELSVKISRGQTDNALKCKHNGGWVPLGYRVNSEQCYELDPLTAPIVREIFELYADGVSAKEIGEMLNKREIRTQNGHLFKKNSLTNMLSNRKYIG